MNIFEFWEQIQQSDDLNIHQEDKVVLEHCNVGFDYSFPPGPYFGPLKNSKLIFFYGNPGIDIKSKMTIQDIEKRNELYVQLSGDKPYPINLPGWNEWFSNKFSNLFGDKLIDASSIISIFNVIPYASENMDNLNPNFNCLKSTWIAQEYLRKTLLPDALSQKRMLVICRSSSLWGIKTDLNSANIIINKSRNGIDEVNKEKIITWFNKVYR